jgi:hypothetical protein
MSAPPRAGLAITNDVNRAMGTPLEQSDHKSNFGMRLPPKSAKTVGHGDRNQYVDRPGSSPDDRG